MYHFQVVPIMEYGSGIWGFEKLLSSKKFGLEQFATFDEFIKDSTSIG